MNTKKIDPADAPQEFMTVAEVAAWLRVALSTVYAWTASGRIPCAKFNGVVRFQRTQLVGWIAQQTRYLRVGSLPGSERISETRPGPLTHCTMVEAAARVKRRLCSTKNPTHKGDGG